MLQNQGWSLEKVTILDAYSGEAVELRLRPHETFTYFAQLRHTFGWYDLTVQAESDATFRRQFAGHLETGEDSVTDPAIGAVKPTTVPA